MGGCLGTYPYLLPGYTTKTPRFCTEVLESMLTLPRAHLDSSWSATVRLKRLKTHDLEQLVAVFVFLPLTTFFFFLFLFWGMGAPRLLCPSGGCRGTRVMSGGRGREEGRRREGLVGRKSLERKGGSVSVWCPFLNACFDLGVRFVCGRLLALLLLLLLFCSVPRAVCFSFCRLVVVGGREMNRIYLALMEQPSEAVDGGLVLVWVGEGGCRVGLGWLSWLSWDGCVVVVLFVGRGSCPTLWVSHVRSGPFRFV